MPTYTECPEEIADAHDSVGPCELTGSVESTGNATSSTAATFGRDFTETANATADYSFVISYDVVSSAVATATAAPSRVVTESVTSGAAATDGKVVAFDQAEESAADAAEAAVPSRTLLVSDSAAAGATAAPSNSVTASEVSSGEISDRVVTVVEHDEVSTGNATDSIRVSIDLDVIDTAAAIEASAPRGFIVWQGASSAAAAAAASSQLVANGDVTSSAVARSAAFVVDNTYPSMWANSERMASAVWRGTPFDSYAMFRGKLIAVGADGLYAFTADADDAGPVIARVVDDLTDFGSTKRKVFDAVNVAAKASAPLRVGVETEQGVYHYTTHLPSSAYPSTHQAKPGRGLTGRYVRYSLDNDRADTNDAARGASFSINEIEAGVGDSSRVR